MATAVPGDYHHRYWDGFNEYRAHAGSESVDVSSRREADILGPNGEVIKRVDLDPRPPRGFAVPND